MIKRNFNCVKKNMYEILYATLVRPHLEYAVPVWAPFLATEISKIEKVQRRVTKIVKGQKNMKYEQRFEKLNLTSMVERRERGDMIYIGKQNSQ